MASRTHKPKRTAWRMGFRRAISCEPLSPVGRKREPTWGRWPSERVAPSPFKGRSRTFTTASVPWCSDTTDIVTRKERRHFLPPPECRRETRATFHGGIKRRPPPHALQYSEAKRPCHRR